jgi:hypothetical protein
MFAAYKKCSLLLRNVCGLKNGAKKKEKSEIKKLERKQLNNYNFQRK